MSHNTCDYGLPAQGSSVIYLFELILHGML